MNRFPMNVFDTRNSGFRRFASLAICAGFMPFGISAETATLEDGASQAQHAEAPTVPPPIEGVKSGFEAATLVELPETEPESEHGLVNVFRLSDQIISGSEPTGEASFEHLKSLGIRTILSVDGKAPSVQEAAAHGLRYVHVPIQYRGITKDEMLRIAKSFRELEGPFYVHCFHGKHRGPAAAAVGRVVLDGAGRENAIAEMRQWCGTSGSYDGLYLTIATGLIPSPTETRAYGWDFPAAHRVDGFRDAMIELARVNDQLKYLSKSGWAPDADHPDVNAAGEAARLIHLFEKGVALEEMAEKPADFRAMMNTSLKASHTLQDRIRAFQAGDATVDQVSEAYKVISNNCKSCHGEYRNG